jgi:hypothetical protein
LALAACSRRLGEKRRVQKKTAGFKQPKTNWPWYWLSILFISWYCITVWVDKLFWFIYIYIGSSWLVICVVICYNQKNLVVSASEMRFGTTFLGHPTWFDQPLDGQNRSEYINTTINDISCWKMWMIRRRGTW